MFHLAAQIDVRHAVADPAHDATVNVVGTATVLEAALRAGAGRVVLASTGGAIYGDADEVPTPETATPRPLSPYARVQGRRRELRGAVLAAARALHVQRCGSPTSTARARTRAGRRA